MVENHDRYDSVSPQPLQMSCKICCDSIDSAMISELVANYHLNSSQSSLFQDFISVDSVRTYKPAPEVYKHLAREVGKLGEEGNLWLISGNPFDVCGARAYGMQAIWIDRAGTGWQDRQGGEPTAVVNSLEEVATVLKSHSSSKLYADLNLQILHR